MKVRPLEKQPVKTACFEEAFLEYLRQRFEFEPLVHYVMAAIHICDETSQDYPKFVGGFLAWFANSFLFDCKGTFPAQTNNVDPADKRWRRYSDCHALLEGWINDDLAAALEEQEERWELIEQVANLRSQNREDGTGKAQRQRSKKTKTDGEVFEDLEDWFGERSHTLRRRHKNLTEYKDYMSGTFPVALIRKNQGFEIKTFRVGGQGDIRINC